MNGERLKAIRQKAGVTQTQLAEKLSVTQNSVWRWEKGMAEPSMDKIVKLAQLFHVTADYLMGLTDDPKTLIPPKQSTRDIVENGFNVMYDQLEDIPQDFYAEIKNVIKENDPDAYAEEFAPTASHIEGVRMVPVVSNIIQVSAGNGNLYPEINWEISGYMPVPESDLMGYTWQGAKYNIITVDGNSMEPYINDGDRLLFAEGIEAGPGEVAVVSYDNALRVKGVLQNKDGTVTLISFNKAFPDRVIDPAEHDFYILGKALRVISSRKIPSTI